MARKQITKETRDQLLHRYLELGNYTEVAREFDLDPRTVKATVKRSQERGQEAHWASVMQHVDQEFYRAHFRDLVAVASSVVQAVEDTKADRSEANPMERIEQRVLFAFTRYAEPGTEAGFVLNGDRLIPASRIEAVVSRLGDALFTHEPALRRAVEDWSGCHLRVGVEIAELRSVVHGLLGQARFQQAGETDPATIVSDVLASMDSQAELSPADLARLAGDRPEAELQTQVLHRIAAVGLPAQLRELEAARAKVEELAETVVLRGRPSGRCDLCPSAG